MEKLINLQMFLYYLESEFKKEKRPLRKTVINFEIVKYRRILESEGVVK